MAGVVPVAHRGPAEADPFAGPRARRRGRAVWARVSAAVGGPGTGEAWRPVRGAHPRSGGVAGENTRRVGVDAQSISPGGRGDGGEPLDGPGPARPGLCQWLDAGPASRGRRGAVL